MWRLFIVALFLSFTWADDFPYVQEVSHRAVYPSQVDGTSTSWSRLPFDHGSSFVLINKGTCLIAASAQNGRLYGAPRKSPVPEKISLDSEFSSSWREMEGASLPSQSLFVTWDSLQATMYIATVDNIFAVQFEFSSTIDSCGKVSAIKQLLASNFLWDEVVGLTMGSSSKQSIILGSATKGVFVIDPVHGSVSNVLPHVAGNKCSSIFWVDTWSALFIANELALWTLRFDENNSVENVDHEWIGGTLDTVPVQMSFDKQNDFLYVAESTAVHRLSREGRFDTQYTVLFPQMHVC